LKSVSSLRGRKVSGALRISGLRFDGALLRFSYALTEELPARIEVGVVVSKRHGSAVQRNRVKRKIRAASRLRLGVLSDVLQRNQRSLSVLVLYRGSKQTSARRVAFADIDTDVDRFAKSVRASLVTS
jgi:ribonuclease P protein component